MDDRATVTLPGEGRTFAFFSGIYRFLITGPQTGGRYAQWQLIVPPGNAPPRHVHSREDESFFVTDGELVFDVEGERVVAPAGTLVNVPIGVRHTFRNESGVEARALISVSPAGLEHFFFDVALELEPGSIAAPPHHHDLTEVREVSARYGVEILALSPQEGAR